ncbi:nucleoside triphosphate pyrophosphohydrolase, partial [Spirochaetota bacterium]
MKSPSMKFKEKQPLYLLEEIASILRGENGCAWDKEQTSNTLKPYLIEEAYEVYDAIDGDDAEHMKEELGDLLYQIYAHAQIAKEKNIFTIDDIARGITEKLIRRHPHVFGDEKVDNPKDVIDRWEKIKKTEKSSDESILDGVPKHLPGLLKAYRIQQKVSRIGFDWENIDDTINKLYEEVGELKEAIASEKKEDILDEAGDMLFSIVNVLRFIKINPEDAILKTTEKFIHRFKYVENRVNEENKQMDKMS